MDVVVLIARVLFIAIFAASGIGHLTQSGAMAWYAQSKGVPAPKAGVIVSGLLMVLGAISVLFGIWGDLGAVLLLVAVLPIAFVMHRYWSETDPGAKMSEQVQFNKTLGLSGGALALFAYLPELGLTVTGPLFSV